MADFGTPVVNPAGSNPAGQGITLLSDVLGLRQRQQQLQLGQQALASGAAQTQQEQQKNSELSSLASFTTNAVKDPSFLNKDGSLNTQKYQLEAMKVAPTYGQAYIGNATANATAAVENRKALLGLANEQRQTIGNVFGAVAAKPGANSEDLLDATQQARGISDDPMYQRALDRALMMVPRTAGMPTDQASLAIQTAARNIALGANSLNAGQSALGAKEFTTPSGDIGFFQGNPQAPGGVRVIGPTVKQGIAPTIVVPPGGIPTEYKGGGGGGAGTPGAGGGPPPTTQDMESWGAYKADLAQRAQVSSGALPQLQAAENALEQIRGGAGAATRAKLAKGLQAIPFMPQSFVDAVANGNLAQSQEAEKYLFLNTFAGLRQAMQSSPHAAEFNAAQELLPNIGTDPRAAKSVLSFMQDQAKRDLAEQQALNADIKAGRANPVTWRADYQARLAAGQVPGVPKSQVPGAGAATESVAQKTATQAELQAYATKHGLSLDAARSWATKQGYTIK